jgi:hypothetical protein
LRESNSVGKNISGFGQIKSQTNILKENGEKINLAKINMIKNEQRSKFMTHA